MPEGDTIHRSAARLRAALAGKPLVRLTVPAGPTAPPSPGTIVMSVEAVGKHLLVNFADGTTLRSHMQMTGSWHLYRAGERWTRPARAAKAVVDVGDWVAVCFNAPVVELRRRADARAAVDHLGPDLARDDVGDPEIDIALHRLDASSVARAEIGNALLDQRIACGVGNIFKSEILFACRVSPFARVADLDEPTRRKLLTTAAAMLRSSTRPGAARPANVYDRAGRPCRRCGTTIERRRQGSPPRLTYWCPQCQ